MSQTAPVMAHIKERFRDRRVVFWHDLDEQYATELEDLDLPAVTTILVCV